MRRIKNLKRRSKDQYCYLSKLLLSIFTLPILLFCSSSSHVFASRLRVSFTPSYIFHLTSLVCLCTIHHLHYLRLMSCVLDYIFGLHFVLVYILVCISILRPAPIHPASCSHSYISSRPTSSLFRLLPYLHPISIPHFHSIPISIPISIPSPSLFASVSACILLGTHFLLPLTPYSVCVHLHMYSSAFLFKKCLPSGYYRAIFLPKLRQMILIWNWVY